MTLCREWSKKWVLITCKKMPKEVGNDHMQKVPKEDGNYHMQKSV